MRDRVAVDPDGEIGVAAVDLLACAGFEQRVLEIGPDPFELGEGRFDAFFQQVGVFRLDLARVFFRAHLVDEDLDPRLVLVVAAAIAVVDPQARLGIGDQPVERDEGVDARRDHRRASHAAADVEGSAQFTRIVLDDLDTDIVQAHRGAVGVAGNHRDLELARQIAEFGMEARPLAQQLGIGPRIDHLVRGSARKVIRADIADAIAAGLDGVHFDLGQIGQDIAGILQLDPVVLDVLPRGEMAVTAIVLVRDIGQRVHLLAVQSAIGDRHPQHVGVELQIEPVHQPERLELVFGQLAFETAARLVAEFLHAGIDHRLVVLVVFVHQITQLPISGSAGLRVRSGRTVGPSARTRSLICDGRGLPSCSSASTA